MVQPTPTATVTTSKSTTMPPGSVEAIIPVPFEQGSTTAGLNNDFDNLLNQMNILNNKINLKNTVAAIAHLNKLLEGINEPFKIITTIQEYTINILPKYNIINNK